jgi:hypothetical protein
MSLYFRLKFCDNLPGEYVVPFIFRQFFLLEVLALNFGQILYSVFSLLIYALPYCSNEVMTLKCALYP